MGVDLKNRFAPGLPPGWYLLDRRVPDKHDGAPAERVAECRGVPGGQLAPRRLPHVPVLPAIALVSFTCRAKFQAQAIVGVVPISPKYITAISLLHCIPFHPLAVGVLSSPAWAPPRRPCPTRLPCSSAASFMSFNSVALAPPFRQRSWPPPPRPDLGAIARSAHPPRLRGCSAVWFVWLNPVALAPPFR